MESKRYQNRRLRLIADAVVGHTVLDVGHAVKLNPYLGDFYCVGYDIQKSTDQGVRYAEEIQGDVKDIQARLSPRQFDTIICAELIEHLENPYQFLRDLYPLLADQGRLVLSTPNPMGWPVFLCELLRVKRFFYTPGHLFYFLPRWVERLLDFCGYQVLAIKPVGLWLAFFVCPYSPSALSYQLVYVAGKK